MKTSRQEKKFRKKMEPDPDLLEQLNQAIGNIDSAMNHFEHVVDPTLIDCYIYEVNSVLKRYKFLLEQAAKINLLPEKELVSSSEIIIPERV